MTVTAGQVVNPAPRLSWLAACDALYRGGFRYGGGLINMLAISEAESNRGRWLLGPLDFTTWPPTLKMNTNGTYDRSWLMINSGHRAWTDAMLRDPVTAARAAFEITDSGRNLNRYVAYTEERHNPYLEIARATVATYYALRGATPRIVAGIANWPGTLPP